MISEELKIVRNHFMEMIVDANKELLIDIWSNGCTIDVWFDGNRQYTALQIHLYNPEIGAAQDNSPTSVKIWRDHSPYWTTFDLTDPNCFKEIKKYMGKIKPPGFMRDRIMKDRR